MTMAESALAVLVPEAEVLVGPYRALYDPSAARGMPAHITLLYPFVTLDSIDDDVLDRLRSCFAGFAPFDFTLTMTGRFAEVLYLSVVPDEPFRELTLAIWQAFPTNPPYGGRYPAIVPHLTIADPRQPSRLDDIHRDFEQASRGKLPILAHADEVTLLDTRSGRWQRRVPFRLGRAARSDRCSFNIATDLLS